MYKCPYFFFLTWLSIIRNFASISSLTGECAAQKIKNFCSSSLWTWSHHMVILISQNKITDFFYDFSLGMSLKKNWFFFVIFDFCMRSCIEKYFLSISRIWTGPISTKIHHKTFNSNLSRLFCQNDYTTVLVVKISVRPYAYLTHDLVSEYIFFTTL